MGWGSGGQGGSNWCPQTWAPLWGGQCSAIFHHNPQLCCRSSQASMVCWSRGELSPSGTLPMPRRVRPCSSWPWLLMMKVMFSPSGELVLDLKCSDPSLTTWSRTLRVVILMTRWVDSALSLLYYHWSLKLGFTFGAGRWLGDEQIIWTGYIIYQSHHSINYSHCRLAMTWSETWHPLLSLLTSTIGVSQKKTLLREKSEGIEPSQT